MLAWSSSKSAHRRLPTPTQPLHPIRASLPLRRLPTQTFLPAISNNDSDEESEIEMFEEEARGELDDDGEEEGGAGSTNAEPTLGFPQVTFLDVQPVDPTLEGAFDFNTKVYKRRKLSVLGFDEKGTTRLLVRVVRCVAPGRDSPITSNETGTHITSTHQATGALGTGSV